MSVSGTVEIAGCPLAYKVTGEGPPVVFLQGVGLHGDGWLPQTKVLRARYRCITIDNRGIGLSKPVGAALSINRMAKDTLAVMDALGMKTAGVVGHDVGGAVMQSMARLAPERIPGLFFFDFVYPGIGARMGTPDRLNEIWYQSFHQMEMAPALLGSSREACRLYIGHILRHWTYRKDAFDDVMDAFVDNFMQPGNLAGGFAYYRAAHAGRIAMMQGTAPVTSPIAIPACVRWAEHDPIFPFAWTDRLHETFSNLDLQMLPGVGHFPHRESPDVAAEHIAGFFSRL